MKYLKYINEAWNKSKDSDISAAIKEIRSLGSVNPFNERETAFGFQGTDHIVLAEVSKFDGHLWINGIQSTERNKGYATQIMNKIIEIADKYQVYCALTPKPYTNFKHKDILNATQLKNWYSKFGFKPTKGDRSLERAPQSSKQEKTLEPLQTQIEPEVVKKGNQEIDPSYTHFAMFIPKNKIVTGWDYKDVSADERKHYSKIDLRDWFPEQANGSKIKNFRVYNINKLKKMGIDPFDSNNWTQLTDND